MNRLVLAVLGLTMLVPCTMAESTSVRIVVMGDRVCLRAAPRDRAEVVCLVSASDALDAYELGAEWVSVVPPVTAAVYIAANWISNGVVKGDGVYVRSGPGVSYPPLGYVQRGDRVDIRRNEGAWVQVAPPRGIRVWIQRQFVSLPSSESGQTLPGAGSNALAVARAEAVVPWDQGGVRGASGQTIAGGSGRLNPVAVSSKPAHSTTGLSERAMDVVRLPVPVVVEPLSAVSADATRYLPVYSGVLDRCAWAIRRPADYRIVGKDSKGRTTTVCFVAGEPEVIRGFLGKRVSVSGVPHGMYDKRTPIVLAGNITIVGE